MKNWIRGLIIAGSVLLIGVLIVFFASVIWIIPVAILGMWLAWKKKP